MRLLKNRHGVHSCSSGFYESSDCCLVVAVAAVFGRTTDSDDAGSVKLEDEGYEGFDRAQAEFCAYEGFDRAQAEFCAYEYP